MRTLATALFLVLLLSAALSGPARAGSCAERPPAPVKLKYEQRPRLGLLAGGLSLGGTLYLLSALAAVASEGGPDPVPWALYLPVAGPFLQLRTAEGGGRAVLLLDGLGQLGGVVMALVGLVRRPVLVYEQRLSVAPGPVGGGAGVWAGGRF